MTSPTATHRRIIGERGIVEPIGDRIIGLTTLAFVRFFEGRGGEYKQPVQNLERK